MVKQNPLDVAIASMYNNATRVVKESKLIRSTTDMASGYDSCSEIPEWKFDAATTTAMRSMLGPGSYTFICSRGSTLTSGTGTFSINSSTNLTQYGEGGALIALFDECKMISGTYRHSGGALGGGSTNFGVYCGFYPSEDTTTPTIAIVTRLRHVITFSTVHPPSGDQTGVLSFKTTGRQWGLTTDEGVSAPRIVSGCNGTIKWVATGAGTPSNSTVYFAYLAKVKIKFRART